MCKRTPLFSLAFVVFLFLSTPLFADPYPAPGADQSASQNTAMSVDFNRIIKAEKTQNAIGEIIKHQADALSGHCSNIFLTPGQVSVLVPLQFGANGLLTQGVWKDSWEGNGCGIDRIYNVITMASESGVMHREPLLPGSSRADMQLQRDSIPYAMNAAKCSNALVVDTAFVGAENATQNANANNLPAPWREDWLVVGCGHSSLVAMHFIPAATGTAISTNPAETRIK